MSRILFVVILFIFSCEDLLNTKSEDCAGVEGGVELWGGWHSIENTTFNISTSTIFIQSTPF